MKNYDVYGIGNALVDTEYEVSDSFLSDAGVAKGLMTLIEEDERQVLIKTLLDHQLAPVKQAGGGSAANTMVAIAQLSGSAFYSCKVANDDTGDFFVKDLIAAGVDTNLGPEREDGATGVCLSMVTPDAERSMTTCLGITNFLSTNELNPEVLAQSARLYIEGYLVSSVTGFQAALEAQKIAKANNVMVSLTLSDPAMVEIFSENYQQLLDQGVDLLFCNHDEARLLTGQDSVQDCIAALKKICPTFVITCGSKGSIAFDGEAEHWAQGVPVTAVDTTGAGDIFAGAFLYSIANNRGFDEANTLANRAASQLVGRFGARLTAEEVETLISE